MPSTIRQRPAKSILLGVLLLLAAIPSAAQLVTMTSAHMGAGYQPANVVWTFCMQPTGVSHNGFQVGSTGQATGQPNCRDVENGVILTTLGGVVIGPMMEPDTSLSAPQNLCLVATLRDVNGLQVLGGNDSGYGCVQPAANNSWCFSGTCNFDDYTPNIATLPLGPTLPYLTVGTLDVTTCTGCSSEPSGPANEIVATPNGSSGVAGLRAMAPADVPSLPESQITNLTSDLAAKLAAALNSADLFVGNGSNVATGVAMSGDCGLANSGAISCTKTSGAAFGALATLAPGALPSGYTVPWGQVTGAPSFLSPTLTSAYFFVGNGSNIATGVAMSGDCGLSNAGAITCTKTGGVAFGSLATRSMVTSAYVDSSICSNAGCAQNTTGTAGGLSANITESQVTNLTSDLAAKLAAGLNSADLFVGNGSNVATGVAMSGDCGLSNAGAITCTKTGGTSFGALATLAPGAFPSGYTIPWGQVTGAPTILAIHGTITPGDCTYWYSSTSLGDAGAACGSGGGGMVYPGAGVANSNGSGWGTSYTVGSAANNLVQLNGSAQLPAVSGINLTGLNPANLGSGIIGSGVSVPYGQVTGAPAIPSASNATPNMDGTGAAGSSAAYARGDHTHPTDTSRAADSAVVHNTGAENVGGVKTFSSSPVVPTPTASTQAVNKGYVDNVYQRYGVTLTPTQIYALGTTEVELVPQPPSHYTLVVSPMGYTYLQFNTTRYSSVGCIGGIVQGTLQLQYEGTGGDGVGLAFDAASSLGYTASNGQQLMLDPNNPPPLVDSDISTGISVQYYPTGACSGTIASGDSPVTFTIWVAVVAAP